MKYRSRHSFWMRTIASLVVCLFLVNDFAFSLQAKYTPANYTLAVPSRFNPITIFDRQDFEEWDKGEALPISHDSLSDESMQESLAKAMEIFSEVREVPKVKILRSGKDVEEFIEEENRFREQSKPMLETMDRRRFAKHLKSDFGVHEATAILLIPRNAGMYGGLGVADMIVTHETGERLLWEIGFDDIRNAIEERYLHDVREEDRWLAPNLLGDLLINTVILRYDKTRYLEQYRKFFEARKKYYKTEKPHLLRSYNLYTRTLEIMADVEKGTFCEPDGIDDFLEERANINADVAEELARFVVDSQRLTKPEYDGFRTSSERLIVSFAHEIENVGEKVKRDDELIRAIKEGESTGRQPYSGKHFVNSTAFYVISKIIGDDLYHPIELKGTVTPEARAKALSKLIRENIDPVELAM